MWGIVWSKLKKMEKAIADGGYESFTRIDLSETPFSAIDTVGSSDTIELTEEQLNVFNAASGPIVATISYTDHSVKFDAILSKQDFGGMVMWGGTVVVELSLMVLTVTDVAGLTLKQV